MIGWFPLNRTLHVFMQCTLWLNLWSNFIAFTTSKKSLKLVLLLIPELSWTRLDSSFHEWREKCTSPGHHPCFFLIFFLAAFPETFFGTIFFCNLVDYLSYLLWRAWWTSKRSPFPTFWATTSLEDFLASKTSFSRSACKCAYLHTTDLILLSFLSH